MPALQAMLLACLCGIIWFIWGQPMAYGEKGIAANVFVGGNVSTSSPCVRGITRTLNRHTQLSATALVATLVGSRAELERSQKCTSHRLLHAAA